MKAGDRLRLATFAGRLRLSRLARGLTLEQLAERADVARNSIQAYEAGAHQPKSDILCRLSSALDVSLDWLCLNTGSVPEFIFDFLHRR